MSALSIHARCEADLRDVKHEDGRVRAAIIHRGHGSEALLPGRICNSQVSTKERNNMECGTPNLQNHVPPIHVAAHSTNQQQHIGCRTHISFFIKAPPIVAVVFGMYEPRM